MTNEPTSPPESDPTSSHHPSDDMPRDINGHRLHPAASAGGFDRRRFMTGVLATTGLAAFAYMSSSALGAQSASAAPGDGTTPPTDGGTPPTDGGTPPTDGGMTEGITDEFIGLTTDGTVVPDLFSIAATGVSTAGVVDAANAWLATLTAEQKASVLFDVDPADYTADEWRLWSNVDGYQRQGLSLADMTTAQRTSAMAIPAAGLSAKGLTTTTNIMKLNEYAGVLIGEETRFNENLYWFTIMGTPSTTDPWGWQIDGHHLVINYFVLGDQVVMTPTFMGSEPVTANFGLDHEYEGISVLDTEVTQAIATINTLTTAEKAKAITSTAKTGDNNVAEAFKDNLVQPYQGVLVTELSTKAQAQIAKLVALFVANMDLKHAAVKAKEIYAHRSETYFQWIGGTGSTDAFYFRVHSPVIWIEFDCETPGPIGQGWGAASVPSRQHIHSDVRTPNGNDYGKSLLALHLALDH